MSDISLLSPRRPPLPLPECVRPGQLMAVRRRSRLVPLGARGAPVRPTGSFLSIREVVRRVIAARFGSPSQREASRDLPRGGARRVRDTGSAHLGPKQQPPPAL